MKTVLRDCVATLAIVFVASGLGTLVATCAAWDGNSAAWFAALSTSLAIVAAVAVVRLQLVAQARADAQRRADLAKVAYGLAGEALELVTNRLDVALLGNQPGSVLELREYRTTETIAAMRQIEPHTLPPTILQKFVHVRAGVYAINTRISDVYRKAAERPRYDPQKKLAGAVNVHPIAHKAFEDLGDLVAAELSAEALVRRAIAVPASIANYASMTSPPSTGRQGSARAGSRRLRRVP